MARKVNRGRDEDWSGGPARKDPEPEPETLLPAPVEPEVKRAEVVPVPPPTPAPLVLPQDRVEREKLSDEAARYFDSSKAPETQRTYRYHWRAFERWCRVMGVASLPADPHHVANYVAFRAERGVPPQEAADDLAADARLRESSADSYVPRRTYAERWKFSTLKQSLAAIRLVHRYEGHLNPGDSQAVSEVMDGIRKTVGARADRKEPITRSHLEHATEALGSDMRGLRDRSILLLGFASMLRRGELAALEVRDLSFSQEGLKLDLARHFSGEKVMPGTKTNPGAERPESLGIARSKSPGLCPVVSTRAWLDAAKITEGRLYRAVHESKPKEGPVVYTLGEPLSPQTVALVVKDAVARMGLDPKAYSGHSLRRGGATSAFRAGKSLPSVQRQTRHAKLDTLMIYLAEAGLFDDNASEGIL